ncbi:hypothetical protein BDR26DRAFT_866792 [Obelidium mucronatum]|nr:hypothetical protein BDR26DRAFT_866792 [Obelidium mucronatum]
MSKPLPIGPDTPYLDPRLDKKMFKQYLDNPEVDMKGQCESCKTPTSKRCSKCKALAVCSPECFKAVWKKHKADCTKLAAAAANAPQGHFPKGIPFVLSSGTDEMQLLGTINKETMDLYVRHGIDGDPPEGDSLLSDQKLAAFFADMLELNDSGSDSHKECT